MNNILSNNKIINDVSSREKVRLCRVNNHWHQLFQSVCNDLGDHLINNTAQGNRSKLGDVGRVIHVGDKRKKLNYSLYPINKPPLRIHLI